MSYITTEYLQQYCAARNTDLSAYGPADIDASVIKSADFFDIYYTFEPALTTYDPLPDMLKRASAEAAIMALRGQLFVDPESVSSGVVESESKSLDGVGSKTVTYAANSAPTFKRSTPVIDALVRPYLAQVRGVYRA